MKKVLAKIKEFINKLIKKESEEDRCNRIFRKFKKIVEGKSEEELEHTLTGDDEFPEVYCDEGNFIYHIEKQREKVTIKK